MSKPIDKLKKIVKDTEDNEEEIYQDRADQGEIKKAWEEELNEEPTWN